MLGPVCAGLEPRHFGIDLTWWAFPRCTPCCYGLQAFAEAQKRDLAAARAELEDSQRSGREGQHRLRGLEEQLLAAQDACGKANSQVRAGRATRSASWPVARLDWLLQVTARDHARAAQQ